MIKSNSSVIFFISHGIWFPHALSVLSVSSSVAETILSGCPLRSLFAFHSCLWQGSAGFEVARPHGTLVSQPHISLIRGDANRRYPVQICSRYPSQSSWRKVMKRAFCRLDQESQTMVRGPNPTCCLFSQGPWAKNDCGIFNRCRNRDHLTYKF